MFSKLGTAYDNVRFQAILCSPMPWQTEVGPVGAISVSLAKEWNSPHERSARPTLAKSHENRANR